MRNILLLALWAASFASADEENVRTNLIPLIPFRVQITLEGLAADVNAKAVDNAVLAWMTTSFRERAKVEKLPDEGIEFGLIDLRRSGGGTQAAGSKVYVASYTGTSLWNRSGENFSVEVEENRIDFIQRSTLIDSAELEALLSQAADETGLGSAVLSTSAFITPDATDEDEGEGKDDGTNNGADNADNDDGGGNNNLEIIIIVAIVVACLAFVLLSFAVCWAWKTDRERRGEESVTSSYANGQQPKPQPQNAPKRQQLNTSPDGTGSESEYDPESPNNGDDGRGADSNGHYPDSVISDDISTSLTAYYRSGMSSYNMPRRHHASAANDMNDAASMSSMDSYGYSLDGYAPSLSGGPTQMGYPVESPDAVQDDHPAGRR